MPLAQTFNIANPTGGTLTWTLNESRPGSVSMSQAALRRPKSMASARVSRQPVSRQGPTVPPSPSLPLDRRIVRRPFL